MTCTHAVIARSHLVDLGFQYDNIIVEEVAQMIEVETFIPLLLQKGETDEAALSSSRLKRTCLVGNDNQLPPRGYREVVQLTI
jgi:intron-binding protein aquarius